LHLQYKENMFELHNRTLPHFHSYFYSTYFVEFTTRMNINTALFFLFAVVAFHCSSRCNLLLFSFVACLSSLLFFVAELDSFYVTVLASCCFFHRIVSLLFLIVILTSLPSRCFPSLFLLLSSRCSRYFFRYPCYIF